MSQTLIRRLTQQVPVTLQTVTSSATTLNLDSFASGAIDLGTLSLTVTTLQMWGSSTADGAYRRVRSAGGTAIDLTLVPSTSEGSICALPNEVFAAPFLRIVAAAAAGAGVPGVVTLKS